MLYDADASTWVPSGPRPGVAKVQLYHNTATNAYRVVGWRLQDREVVLNCAIVRGLKYQCARRTFHQWRDSKQVYGLNFTSGEEADEFAAAIESALGHLAALHQHQQLQQQPQQASLPPRPPVKPPNPYEANNHYDSSQEQPRPPQSVTRIVTGAYVDMSQASIIPPNSRASATPTLGRHHSVTAEYAYPGHATVDAQRPGPVDHGYSRTDCTGTTTVNGTIANGNGGTYAPPRDSRYYSSSDDSVKGLVARDGANFPNQIRTSPNEVRSNPNQSISPSVSSGTLPNGPDSAPTAPPVIPPPPPPLFPNEPANTARASRPLHRSTVTPPAVSDAGDDEDDVSGVNEGGLAAQLRMAKQHRLRAASVANVGSESQGSATVGRAAGLDMISDLQRVLAARRRAKEAEESDVTDSPAGDAPASQSVNGNRPPTNANPSQQQQSTGRATSIVPGFATLRKNSSPALDTNSLNFLSSSGNGMTSSSGSSNPAATDGTTVSRADLEAFKRELMAEFRREVQQLKNDPYALLPSTAAPDRRITAIFPPAHLLPPPPSPTHCQPFHTDTNTTLCQSVSRPAS
ncbi:WH1 domain protein, partial [Opisthorchis viverrini]